MISKVSIIIPTYNEEENIFHIYEKIKEVLMKTSYNYEIIYVNDGSKDRSQDIIEDLSNKDKRVKFVEFTRNFGHQAAILAGYDHANGDAIITMDCDLQDPPELIPLMLKKWSEGFDVVYARRVNREDGFFKKFTARYYYSLIKNSSGFVIPEDVGDFRLIDRKTLGEIKKMKEKSIYLRGMVAWTGFPHTFVDFDRPNRKYGQTKYSLKKMTNLAIDGIFNNSRLPISMISFLTLISIFTFLITFVIATLKYSSIIKLMTLFIMILLTFIILMIWIVGNYLVRIYDEIKDRPRYIIKKKSIK